MLKISLFSHMIPYPPMGHIRYYILVSGTCQIADAHCSDPQAQLFPAYQAGSGLNVHARFLASYQVTRHWAFVAVAEYERMNPDAAASPIVEERNVFGLFTGFRYEY